MAENGNGSDWTKDAMMKYIDERFASLKEQLHESDAHLKEYLSDRISSQKDAIGVAMVAADKATAKAEAAMDKRLEGMNEFRNQLKDQTATFIGRLEYEAKRDLLITKSEGDLKLVNDKIHTLNERMNIIASVQASGVASVASVKESKTESKQTRLEWKDWVLFAIVIAGFVINYLGR
jgi:hypothetical protein